MTTGPYHELEAILKAGSFQILQQFLNRVKLGMVPVMEWEYFDSVELEKAILLNKSNYSEHTKEYHKVFTDIHITLSGQDTIYLGTQIISVTSPYQENSDSCLIESPTTSTFNIPQNCFALLKPHEIHSNSLQGDDALKVVIKIK